LTDPSAKHAGRLAVIGAGLMGHAIAQVFASAGWIVTVQDPSAAARDSLARRIGEILSLLDLDASALARVSATGDLAQAVAGADLIVEAAPENPALKADIFERLEAIAPPQAVLATNTSAIPVGEIGRKVRDGGRLVGTHFWNPPYAVRLVEVVQTERSDPRIVAWVMKVLRDVDMLPVHVRRDVPGFVGNRLQHALKREAIALVAGGVCDAATLDLVVREGFGARLGVLGPLEQSDMIGLDLTLAIHKVIMPHLDTTPEPHPHLAQAVADGSTGMRAGRGFRSWTEAEIAATRARFKAFLAERAAARRREIAAARTV
jgi:3-hydroxybutyryl-CoA dehydrogenase